MRLAICLQTSNRADLTKRTLESFTFHNGWCARALWDTYCFHGDDASSDTTNKELAYKHGFKTIVENKRRQGAHGARRQLIEAAVEACSPTHIFVLENDWECVRPLPWNAIDAAFRRPDIYAFRFYHEHKQADLTRPTGDKHAGRNKADPQWTNTLLGGEECEVGSIHWGAPPAIVRVVEMQWLHEGTRADSNSMRKSGQIEALTARVTQNAFWHIGLDRTPEFAR